MFRSVLAGSFAIAAHAAKPEDLVDKIPGFNATDFQVYSGYLSVPGPFKLTDYDSLSIHYQFSMAQSNAASRPVVAWHQGGPGGSSVQGGYIEMGYFLVNDEIKMNPHAWNQVANMLYLESPAGSGQDSGFSTCLRGGKTVDCSWDDLSQAEAYAHTLLAFFGAFSEYKTNDFYMAGESYFGQYGPNIANHIVSHDEFSSINLAGLLVGNGCWGGTETSFQCNGPNAEKNDIDIVHGKGLLSSKQYKKVYQACGWASGEGELASSAGCRAAQAEADLEVGPFNVYDVYDNCPKPSEYLDKTGKSMRWLKDQLRDAISPAARAKAHKNILEATGPGGFDWDCGGTYPPGKVADFFLRKDVQEALHLNPPGQSGFDYATTGPASITVYPELAKKIRIMIYNGDADLCVPMAGNEEWITDLEEQGVLKQAKAWRPWFADEQKSSPAGSVTTYDVVGSSQTLTFLTIRLSGHMVPLFTPGAALSFFSNFIQEGTPIV